MANRCNTRKNTSGLKKPPSLELKDSTTTSKKPLDFPTFEFSGRYPLDIPSQSTPDPHQDSSSNEYFQGVTLEDPLYCIPNIEVD